LGGEDPPLIKLPEVIRRHAPEIGVSADLITVAGAMAVAGPALVGYVAGSLEAGLLVALAVALLMALNLAIQVRSQRRRLRHQVLELHSANAQLALARALFDAFYELNREYADARSALADIRAAVEAVLGEIAPPDAETEKVSTNAIGPTASAPSGSPGRQPPSLWLPNPHDLRSFAMTPADFEKCAEVALGRTVHDIGPDAWVSLMQVVLLIHPYTPSGPMPHVLFIVQSASTRKRADVTFRGSVDDVVINLMNAGHPSTPPSPRTRTERPPPWETGPRFDRLVHAAWIAISPIEHVAAVVLRPTNTAVSGLPYPWVLVNVAGHGGPYQKFSLQQGRLVRL
jgi:hypothetical protein